MLQKVLSANSRLSSKQNDVLPWFREYFGENSTIFLK